MSRYVSSDDEPRHQPVTWLNGHPVYAAHFIVVVFVGSMLVTTIMNLSHLGGLLGWLPFRSDEVLHGQVWRIVSYGLLNPPESIWFIVDMFMIAIFGRELEKFFGRRIFFALFACLYLLTPLLFTVVGIWRPMYLAGETGAFALFIAFATLYPNAVLMFNILAKWFAIVLVGFYTLVDLSNRDVVQLISLWATVGFAYGFVRFEQGALTLPRLRWPARKPKLRVLPDLPAKKPVAVERGDDSMAEVDELLDKIARSGIGSLTARERAKLDRARAALLSKKGK